MALTFLTAIACSTTEHQPDAGTTVSPDANGITDHNADSGTPASDGGTHVFVPDADCTHNDPEGRGGGVVIERCPCDSFGQDVCCTNGESHECTGLGWRSQAPQWCLPGGESDAGIEDAGYDPIPLVECRACNHGALGCWCLPDRMCDPGLVCRGYFCGLDIP
jgi:hypothetical protein